MLYICSLKRDSPSASRRKRIKSRRARFKVPFVCAFPFPHKFSLSRFFWLKKKKKKNVRSVPGGKILSGRYPLTRYHWHTCWTLRLAVMTRLRSKVATHLRTHVTGCTSWPLLLRKSYTQPIASFSRSKRSANATNRYFCQATTYTCTYRRAF